MEIERLAFQHIYILFLYALSIIVMYNSMLLQLLFLASQRLINKLKAFCLHLLLHCENCLMIVTNSNLFITVLPVVHKTEKKIVWLYTVIPYRNI